LCEIKHKFYLYKKTQILSLSKSQLHLYRK